MTLTKTPPPRKPTTTHKKRQGSHHRQNHHYVKTYWPYLPLLLVVGVGLVLNTTLKHADHSVLGYATSISDQVLLADTNNARTTDKEANLSLSPILSEAAQAKANDMAKRDYWNHVTPDGKQPWSFIDATGYQYQSAGENLAYGFGTSDEVVSAWMQSPEHRDNILNGDYQEVGFGTANVANYIGHGPATIIVAEYAQPSGVNVTAYVKGTSQPITVNVASTTRQVSRLQTVATSRITQFAVAALFGAAVLLFIIRHGRAWHRAWVKGEQFAVHHPWADIFLIAAVMMWFILSPIVGNIL